MLELFEHGLRAQFAHGMKHNMPAAHQFGQFGAGFGRAQAPVDFANRCHAGDVVAVVARQNCGGGERFAQVVQQRGVALGQA